MAAKTRQSGYFPRRPALKPINALIIALTVGLFSTAMAQAKEVFMNSPCSVTINGEREALVHIDRYSSPRRTKVRWFPQGSTRELYVSIDYDLTTDRKLGSPRDAVILRGFIEMQTPPRSNSALVRITAPNGDYWLGSARIIKMNSMGQGYIMANAVFERRDAYGSAIFDSVNSGVTWTVTVEGDAGEIFARTNVDFSALAERDRMLAEALGKINSIDVSKCPVMMGVTTAPSQSRAAPTPATK